VLGKQLHRCLLPKAESALEGLAANPGISIRRAIIGFPL
jgi:hypothetical protein